ncbi:formylglycine-generating enzyme family protein [Cognatilysobacter segetis]|uniref:formylglycine-generating enzyme family protein n=1 Tax=Cognatilysobacter segetis TaxID=2492394 RepID=UPI00105CDD93|nr:formylglycine-generating enzyme family protein [Lysobacter segetis]
MRTKAPTTRVRGIAIAVALLAGGCGQGRDAPPPKPRTAPTVTVAGSDDRLPTWRAPRIEVDRRNALTLAAQADRALSEGRFVEDDGALPIFLALRAYEPIRTRAEAGVVHSIDGLLLQAREALSDIDTDPGALDRVRQAAAALRVVALDRPDVERFLQQVDRVEDGQRFSELGEAALARGDVGEAGGGAIGFFRRALALRATDARARQGLAAAESALIRRAEDAAAREEYAGAERWLAFAAAVRPDNAPVAEARARIAFERAARIGDLRDAGIAALPQPKGIEIARGYLAHILRIAPAADPTAAELRRRIDFAVHYGLFVPGQRFTDGLQGGGRTPTMIVVPHGDFVMGAPAGERGATDAERPTRPLHFQRGFAMSVTEVTVGQFRRFVESTGYRPRSTRRGYSVAYDLRSGNFARRGHVDWRDDYLGRPAADDLPVIHVSAKDASAYAQWLADQTGHRYRLPSEAEFEYALRAGARTAYPWGTGTPPPGAGNFTGAADRSPTGRGWTDAFRGYLDGAWGPTPVGRYRPGRFGLHDLGGNVSEWVADCWHASYRRAPRDQRAWVNPGCRQRVVRGGSWASAPAQTRSAFRAGLDADTTNARIGFRVVRDL